MEGVETIWNNIVSCEDVYSSRRRTWEGMYVHCGGVVLVRVYTEIVCTYCIVLVGEYNNGSFASIHSIR